jgi:hypothetical protein
MKAWLERQHVRLTTWCDDNVDALEWAGVVAVAACAGAMITYTVVWWP